MMIPNELLNIIFSYVERPKTHLLIKDLIGKHDYNYPLLYTFTRFNEHGEEIKCGRLYSASRFANSYFRIYEMFKELTCIKKSFGIMFKIYIYIVNNKKYVIKKIEYL